MTFKKNRGGEMSLNIINLLQQHVTPIVLADENDDLLLKKHALTDFYSILLTAINSKPELFEQLRSQLEPDIIDVFDGNVDITQQVLNYISGEASTQDVNVLLNASLAPSLNLLVSEAGSSDVQVIEHLVKGQMPVLLNALPHWSVDLLKMAGIKYSIAEIREELKQPEELKIIRSKHNKKSFPMHYLVILILIVLLFMVVRAFISHESENKDIQHENTAVSEVVSASSTSEEQVNSKPLVKNPLPEIEKVVQPVSSAERVEETK